RCRKGMVVHTGSIPVAEITEHYSIPTTTPARTLLDLGAVASDAVLELAVESALRKRQTSISRLRHLVDKHSARGRRGPSRLGALLDSRGVLPPTESHLETRFACFLRALSKAGLPPPARQHSISDRDGFVARVDFAYPQSRLALQVLSFEFHSGRESWLKDVRQFDRLIRAGWSVLPLTEEDLHEPPMALLRDIGRRLGIHDLFDIDGG
ncbi:MAG TPA: hypothetical protein VFK89_03150, partial [Actinomycetota bacterium]|nr:hypothetical protein [Actinomycetota bacterium]